MEKTSSQNQPPISLLFRASPQMFTIQEITVEYLGYVSAFNASLLKQFQKQKELSSLLDNKISITASKAQQIINPFCLKPINEQEQHVQDAKGYPYPHHMKAEEQHKHQAYSYQQSSSGNASRVIDNSSFQGPYDQQKKIVKVAQIGELIQNFGRGLLRYIRHNRHYKNHVLARFRLEEQVFDEKCKKLRGNIRDLSDLANLLTRDEGKRYHLIFRDLATRFLKTGSLKWVSDYAQDLTSSYLSHKQWLLALIENPEQIKQYRFQR